MTEIRGKLSDFTDNFPLWVIFWLGGGTNDTKKEKALAALLSHKTRYEAARAAGITEKTLRGYFEDEEFRRRYAQACSEIVSDATRQAQQGAESALAVLREIMENRKENSRSRIQAARSTLDFALRLTETNDILDRLTELERDEYDG